MSIESGASKISRDGTTKDAFSISSLSKHSLYFSANVDRARVVLKVESSQGSQIVMRPAGHEELEGYVRLLWRCDDLRNSLNALDENQALHVNFIFPKAVPNDVQWIALVQGDPQKGVTFFHQIWQRSWKKDLKSGQGIAAQLSGLDPTKELHLCFHLNAVKTASVIAAPEISVGGTQSFVIEHAEFADFSVSVAGLVYDKQYPGMPVFVQLFANGEMKKEGWARIAIDGNEISYRFKFAFPHNGLVPLSDLSLLIPATGETLKIALSEPVVQDLDQKNETKPILAAHTIVGVVDSYGSDRVSGWAMCKECPDTPVDLILWVDGEPHAHVQTRTYRKDVAEMFNGYGFVGFEFEITPGLVLSHDAELSVTPLIGINKIKTTTFQLGSTAQLRIASDILVDRSIPNEMIEVADEMVSVIVLNQNGADLLEEMFSSTLRYERPDRIEWIIIDHQSKDRSEDVCKAAAKHGHQVTFIKRNGNYSFSDSNNFGAAAATHKKLIFANNDLIFHGPFVDKIVSALNDPEIGAVGASLMDYIPEDTAWRRPFPKQHLGVYFNTVLQGPWLRAYEMRETPEVINHIGQILSTPVTTGAFFGIRRADFEMLGGFDPEFFYGLEDVDLCLKVMFNLKRVVATDNSLEIAHHRGFSRNKAGDTSVRRRCNNNLLNSRWGSQIRKSVRRDILRNPAFWTGKRPVFGFVVEDVGDATGSSEYFTAMGLARALQKIHPIHIRFLTKAEWMDLSDIDVLIVMVNGFNLHQVNNASPYLIAINWAWQWFDCWADDETLHSYDIVYASSQRAADFINIATGISAEVLPFAVDFDRFSSAMDVPEFASDYCLMGDKVGAKSEIEFHLDPSLVAGIGAIFGHNWETTELASISRGPIAHSRIAEVYASSKIALVDTKIGMKAYGSCHADVFESIAGGALLITNGALGVQELFGDLVPTYANKEQLTDTLNYWIANDRARIDRIAQLQAIVKEHHTYDVRAKAVSDRLVAGTIQTRISIKCPVPYAAREKWADADFARSLAASLRKQGFTVRIDFRENWYASISNSDDVVIALRGDLGYQPQPHQLSILWLISHPSDITVAELARIDQVFVASKAHAKVLSDLTDVPVAVLLNCTDSSIFKFDETLATADAPPLFVGNSDGMFRSAVRWSIELEAEVDVYGSDWGQFITDGRLKGENIPNAVLPDYYRASAFVICEHSEDMRRLGYLSHRAFDVLAVGGWIAVDDVVGIADVLDGGYSVFHNKDELRAVFENGVPCNLKDRRKRAQWVAENHSFDARANVLAETIHSQLAARVNEVYLTYNGA